MVYSVEKSPKYLHIYNKRCNFARNFKKQTTMKKQTLAIDTPYQQPDAYGALSMPVYHCAAYEFGNAEEIADAFCGRSDMPDYSRVTNPTVTSSATSTTASASRWMCSTPPYACR